MGVKRSETNLACDQFSKCSPQPGTPIEVELHGEEKREEGDRDDQDEMRWNQKRREQASQ